MVHDGQASTDSAVVHAVGQWSLYCGGGGGGGGGRFEGVEGTTVEDVDWVEVPLTAAAKGILACKLPLRDVLVFG